MKGQMVLDQNLSDLLASSIRHDNNAPPENAENASLTNREREILELIASGKSNKLIARELKH